MEMTLLTDLGGELVRCNVCTNTKYHQLVLIEGSVQIKICPDCVSKMSNWLGNITISTKWLEDKITNLSKKCRILQEDKGSRFGTDNREGEYNELCGELEIYQSLHKGDDE